MQTKTEDQHPNSSQDPNGHPSNGANLTHQNANLALQLEDVRLTLDESLQLLVRHHVWKKNLKRALQALHPEKTVQAQLFAQIEAWSKEDLEKYDMVNLNLSQAFLEF